MTARAGHLLAVAALVTACTPVGADGVTVRVDQREYGFQLEGMVGSAVAPVLVARRRGERPFGPEDLKAAQAAVTQHCAARGQAFRADDGREIGLPEYWDGTWTIAGACV